MKSDGMKSNGMGAWMIKLLGLLPYLVSGAEQIHGDAKTGAEKKQLVLEALGLAANTAAAVDPEQAPVIAAVTQLASVSIDGVKSVYNAAKGKTNPAPAPGPALVHDPNAPPATFQTQSQE